MAQNYLKSVGHGRVHRGIITSYLKPNGRATGDESLRQRGRKRTGMESAGYAVAINERGYTHERPYKIHRSSTDRNDYPIQDLDRVQGHRQYRLQASKTQSSTSWHNHIIPDTQSTDNYNKQAQTQTVNDACSNQHGNQQFATTILFQ